MQYCDLLVRADNPHHSMLQLNRLWSTLAVPLLTPSPTSARRWYRLANQVGEQTTGDHMSISAATSRVDKGSRSRPGGVGASTQVGREGLPASPLRTGVGRCC
jgi:hypothetical protein